MTRTLNRVRNSVLAKDTSLALVGEGLTMMVLVISFTLLGRRLGPEGYGAFAGLYGLLGPGISINHSAVGLTIYEHVVGRGESPRSVGASIFTSTLGIGAVLAAVVVLLGSIMLPTLPLNVLILFAVGEMVITAVLMNGIALVQAVQSFAAATRLRILAVSLRGAMIVALAAYESLTLRNLAIGQIVMALTTMVVVGRSLHRELGHAILPGRIQWSDMKSIFTYASGLSAYGIQTGGDKVVLNSAGHVADAGLYGAGYRIIQMAQVPINALVYSTHLSFLSRHDRDPVQLSLRYSLIAGTYAVLAVVGIVLLAPVLPILLGAEFEEATSVVRWLAPIIVFAALTQFPANGLLTYDRNSLRTKIFVGNALFSVAMYIALIPAFSWRGAIIATVISEFTMVVTFWSALLLVRRQQDMMLETVGSIE